MPGDLRPPFSRQRSRFHSLSRVYSRRSGQSRCGPSAHVTPPSPSPECADRTRRPERRAWLVAPGRNVKPFAGCPAVRTRPGSLLREPAAAGDAGLNVPGCTRVRACVHMCGRVSVHCVDVCARVSVRVCARVHTCVCTCEWVCTATRQVCHGELACCTL